MKKCRKCGIEKNSKLFSKSSKNKDGLQSYCKECFYKLLKGKYPDTRKKCAKNWYIKNKDEFIIRINKWSKDRDFGLHRTYWAMVRRCKYPSQDKYKYYGGKGITVEWESYASFKKDMYVSFIQHIKKYGKKQTTIDRIDSNKNYCKENCRWATYKIQNNH